MRVWVAVWTGSAAISHAVARWLHPAPVQRLFVVLLVAGFLKGLPWTTGICLVLAAAWLVLAVVLGLRAAKPKPEATADEDEEEHEEEPEEEAEPDDDAEPVAPAALERAELVAALHAVASPHAHLAALAEHLRTTPDRVREGLRVAGVPTAGGVRMEGRGVSTGVRAADIPPLPSDQESAPGDVVAAGQRATTTATTSPQVDRREGMTIIHAVREEVNDS